jgi:protease-4
VSRRSLLLSLAAFSFLAVTVAALVIALIVAFRGDTGGFSAFGGGRIAVLELNGTITDDRQILDDLTRFRNDRSVRGYLVEINSPGGVVGPAQSIFEELKRLRREGKPVVASIGAVGASGGYYVALGADSIFALPGSMTGSIGVIIEAPDASGLMEKVGVAVNVVKSAEHKDVGSPFRPMTAGDRAVLDSLVRDVYRQFVEAVQQERHLTAAQVQALADGRVLSGRQALRSGLIDRTGNMRDALAAVGRMSGLGAEPRVVRPARKRFSLLDLLLERGGEGGLANLVKPLQDAAAPRLEFAVPW